MKLRELRKEKGPSMKELGEALGCSESTISLYENGKREPSFEMLLKMGEFFGVTVDYLLGNEGKDPSQKAEASDNDIKFALFGGGPVTYAQFEEVKQFVRFIKERDANGGIIYCWSKTTCKRYYFIDSSLFCVIMELLVFVLVVVKK